MNDLLDKYKKIAVIGGDRRQAVVARRLTDVAEVIVCGMPEEIVNDERVKCTDVLADALSGVSSIILPLPASSDGFHINAPLSKTLSEIKLTSILKLADCSTQIFGGRLPTAFTLLAEEKGLKIYDFFESETLQIKNAYTTAEAALSIAMNTLSKNVRGSRIAITGYGRISKLLSRLLLSVGAEVTVAARKASDLAFASTERCTTLSIAEGSKEIYSLCHGYDVIFNTVPSRIFDREFLEKLDKKTAVIELASSPGGVDICAAKELGTNMIWALSLPGKYAPESAGEHIAETLKEII